MAAKKQTSKSKKAPAKRPARKRVAPKKATPAKKAAAAKRPAARKTVTKAAAKNKPGKKAPAKKKPAKRVALKTAVSNAPAAITLRHAVFGTLTVDPANCIYWSTRLVHGAREVSVSLTVGDVSDSTLSLLDKSAAFVTRMTAFDAHAREHLRESHERDPDSAVALYREHHLDELSEEALTKIFGKPKDAVATEDFLAKLSLRRVGLCPSSTGGSATFDYTLSPDETDYVLAVAFDDDGTIVGVEMES